ncbi:MAG: VWA domain-containing protein [Candidatus Sulfopaludibacter sp.]|nr:VWA domain-containing protein [Candidatus Sulfopaludibacter sp.]
MMRSERLRSRFWGLVLATALAGSVAAQPRIVRLNVTAFDGHGQPAADLTRADFQIQDAGKDQPLVFFDAIRPAPGTVSHCTLILFDLLNADITNRTFAADEIVKSLQARESSDFLYFYLLTPDLKIQTVHGLPAGAADIRPAGKPWTKNIRLEMSEALKNANQLRQGGLTDDERVRRTFAALNTIISSLALLPGPKNVVWISRGVPISLRVASGGDALDYKPMLRELAKVCTREKVTVFTVNPSTSAVPSTGELASVETLQTIAKLTGGRLYTANSTGKAVAQATDGWRGEYSLGYLPSDESWDGQFHKLKVSTGRKGIELLAPEGYYADRPDPTEAMRVALQNAVSSPFDSPEIGLRATAAKGNVNGLQDLEIRVNYEDALVLPKDGKYATDLVLAIVDYGALGPKSISPPDVMHVSMNEQQNAAAKKDGILLTREHAVGGGIERMRLIVYDPATHLWGAAMVAVK